MIVLFQSPSHWGVLFYCEQKMGLFDEPELSFQSPSHRGSSSHSFTEQQLTIRSGVSIPFSSGHSFQLIETIKGLALKSESFNPLLIGAQFPTRTNRSKRLCSHVSIPFSSGKCF